MLRLITSEEACDSGTVKLSSNIKIAYMPQIIRFEDENLTALETLRYAYDLTEEKARSILANFRFKATDVLKKVGNLSGGEKSRLKLCLLMQSKVNFLILDEPTNHLDIESREWIEDAVADWEGTMLFISHDRYFLNKFASRIWSMADGEITDFYGSLDDYLETITAQNQASPGKEKVATQKNQVVAKSNQLKNSSARGEVNSPAKTKVGAAIPVETQIYEAEAELEKVNWAIESGQYKTDHKKTNALYQEKHRLEEKIESLYSQWAE